MKKVWHEDAWDEYVSWLTKDKKVVKRINQLIKSIERNGYKCIGKPEPLVGNFSGWWSVRITQKDRMVFKIEKDRLVIIQCGNHYNDH